jgi:hypothetical protein
MKQTRRVAAGVLSAMAIATVASHAAVLCQRKSGAVFVRSACRKKETSIDLAQFGAVGPKGDKGDPGVGPFTTCPPDSVLVGTTCVDRYEASVWSIPAANTALVDRVKAGTATVADLTAAGAIEVSPGEDCAPAFPPSFPATGNWTAPLYALSVPGVPPAGCVSWFRAEQACRLSGKRLLSNEEWQGAAAGTPDGTPCVVSAVLGPTGTPGCVSQWGAFDMTGNAAEWVADWTEAASNCTNWSVDFGSDISCIAGDGLNHLPGALLRGGSASLGTDAGIFAIDSGNPAYGGNGSVGFRCAR